MSMAEDFMEDVSCEEGRYSSDDKYWTTKDGKTIPIYSMETSHLINTVSMLVRNEVEVPYEMLRELHYRRTYNVR